MLTVPAHLNPDILIWCRAQLSNNEICHYSNSQHGGVMGLSLYQPLGHRPNWRKNYFKLGVKFLNLINLKS